MTNIVMLDCFLILFARERFHGKKQRTAKMQFYGKTFSYKLGVSNGSLSATDSVLLKLIGPFGFIPVHKLSLHDKLSMYNYEL